MSTIESEIIRINSAKKDIQSAIRNKGVSVPVNTSISDTAQYVNQISGGGGGNTPQIIIEDSTITSIDLGMPYGTTIIDLNITNNKLIEAGDIVRVYIGSGYGGMYGRYYRNSSVIEFRTADFGNNCIGGSGTVFISDTIHNIVTACIESEGSSTNKIKIKTYNFGADPHESGAPAGMWSLNVRKIEVLR